MSDRTTRRKVWVMGGAALLLVAAWVLLCSKPALDRLLARWSDDCFRERARISLNFLESEAIEEMGAPRETVTAAQVASEPNKAWWGSSSAPAPPFPVTHRVLIYYEPFTNAFVYIGTNGHVEHLHLAGSSISPTK